MKRSFLILPLLLLFTIATGPLFAQSGNQFDRDIRIAEGIIEELFGDDDSPRPFLSREIRSVSGQYIPGYGIHFSIGAGNSPFFFEVAGSGDISIDINDRDDSAPDTRSRLTRELVEERFMEYLKNYAPLLDELPNDEVIRLTYGGQSNAPNVFFLRINNSDDRYESTNMTTWVSASDIRAYIDNTISENEFESRVEIVDLSEREKERDQTVFASILQTSLEEVSDTIRIRRSPVAEYLPGLGLSYTINANLRSGWFDFGDIQIDALRIKTDSLSVEISNMLDEIDMSEFERLAERIDSITGLAPSGIDTEELERSAREAKVRISQQEQRERLSDEDVTALVDRFHDTLIETVQDYGPTLRSLNNDEMLLITINWEGRHSALPARTELRIQKSDLVNGNEPVLEIVDRGRS